MKGNVYRMTPCPPCPVRRQRINSEEEGSLGSLKR